MKTSMNPKNKKLHPQGVRFQFTDTETAGPLFDHIPAAKVLICAPIQNPCTCNPEVTFGPGRCRAKAARPFKRGGAGWPISLGRPGRAGPEANTSEPARPTSPLISGPVRSGPGRARGLPCFFFFFFLSFIVL